MDNIILSKFDQQMLDYCIVKAINNESLGRYSIYAAATNKRGVILAEAGNNYCKTHPLQSRYGSKTKKEYLHAEIAVLAKLIQQKKLNVYTLYLARVCSKKHTIGLAKPCPVCSQALQLANIERIVYTE
jgi:tRNA(Arg) A34 adenosine deaminase TadA